MRLTLLQNGRLLFSLETYCGICQLLKERIFGGRKVPLVGLHAHDTFYSRVQCVITHKRKYGLKLSLGKSRRSKTARKYLWSGNKIKVAPNTHSAKYLTFVCRYSNCIHWISHLQLIMHTKHHQYPVRFSSQTWKRHIETQDTQIPSESDPWDVALQERQNDWYTQ